MLSRLEVRKSRLTPVVVSHDSWPWPELLVAAEISPRGLFVASDVELRQGEELRVSFRIGTDELFEYEGIITHQRRRRRSADHGFTGFGVELCDTTPLERIRMRSLLMSTPPSISERALLSGDGLGDRRQKRRAGGRRTGDLRRGATFFVGTKEILTTGGSKPMVPMPRRLIQKG